ncbi:MAG: hypothetical protein ACNYPH_02555 [Gammaproteobacteria bacterium WSBS_2016_MAG_OTU1]
MDIFFFIQTGNNPNNIVLDNNTKDGERRVFYCKNSEEGEHIQLLNEDEIVASLFNNGSQEVLEIHPDTVIIHPRDNPRKIVGHDFFRTHSSESSGKVQICTATSHLNSFYEFHKVWPDATLTLDNKFAKMESETVVIYVDFWMFGESNFCSLTAFAENKQIHREISHLRINTLASDIRFRVKNILETAAKLEYPIKAINLSVNSILFGKGVVDKEFETQIDQLSKGEMFDSVKREAGNFAADIYKEQWPEPYQHEEFVVGGIYKHIAWNLVAAVATVAFFATATLAVQNWQTVESNKKEIVQMKKDIDIMSEKIGDLARNNISKYAALYTILPSHAHIVKNALVHSDTAFSIVAEGARWDAKARVGHFAEELLNIRNKLHSQLPEECAQSFVLSKTFDFADFTIGCDFS